MSCTTLSLCACVSVVERVKRVCESGCVFFQFSRLVVFCFLEIRRVFFFLVGFFACLFVFCFCFAGHYGQCEGGNGV